MDRPVVMILGGPMTVTPRMLRGMMRTPILIIRRVIVQIAVLMILKIWSRSFTVYGDEEQLTRVFIIDINCCACVCVCFFFFLMTL